MGLFSRKRTIILTREEALACKPMKNHQVRETRLDGGEVRLSYPLAVRPWFVSVTRRMGVSSPNMLTKTLQLDQLGTTVWDLLDGEHTVRNIIVLFGEQYKLQQREAEVSVTQFLHSLGKRGLIGMG